MLLSLSWLDFVTVGLSILTVILVQLFVASVKSTKKLEDGIYVDDDYTESTSTNTATTTPTHTLSSSPSLNSNGPTLSHTSSIDSINSYDEYHEDEDTLSLENVFPCDQTDVYASKKINFIIDELLQTEVNFVANLKKGIRNYGNIFERSDVPTTLSGVADCKYDLLGNIDEILELHEVQILPMLQRNRNDLKQLFDEFSGFFDRNQLYCYVAFTMNKKTSMHLRQENREWFTSIQTELKDKLGIDSFLVQPIQRLTRYPLLLQQFILEFYKSGINCKPVLTSCCKLETRMRRLLEVVNQSEEILSIEEINELSIPEQGHFRKSTEFLAYNHKSRKKYQCKVFIFDRCLICVEIRKKRLAYRCHFPWENIKITLNTSKSIMIANKMESREELELSAPEASTVKQWMRSAQRAGNDAAEESERKRKFSLPMDLVLMVGVGFWLMLRFLF